MALYGYTIGDVDINPGAPDLQFGVYRFLIPTHTTVPIAVELVRELTVPATVGGVAFANPDLEGLATSYTSGAVTAVNEPDSLNAEGPGNPDPNARFSAIDLASSPVGVFVPNDGTTVTNRFGTESGADIGSTGFIATSNTTTRSSTPALYNLTSNDLSTLGAVGSSVYRWTLSNPGAVTLLDGVLGGATTTPSAAEIAGTTPTNPGKYADGLAVDNTDVLTGTAGVQVRRFGFASDFRTSDGNGNNLYRVDLLTGQLSSAIAILDSKGSDFRANVDSGLAFSRVPITSIGSEGVGALRLIALLENGTLLEFTDFIDDLASGGGNGRVTAHFLGQVNLPNAGAGATVIDYEGFTIASETTAGAPSGTL